MNVDNNTHDHGVTPNAACNHHQDKADTMQVAKSEPTQNNQSNSNLNEQNQENQEPETIATESEPFIEKTEDEAVVHTSKRNTPNRAEMTLSGSFASFREDVYSPTTAQTGVLKTNCRQKCRNHLLRFRHQCYRKLRPIMWKYNAHPSAEASCCSKLKYSLMCPPRGRFGYLLLVALCITLGFGLIISMFGADGLPGGTFFGLYVLFLCCVLAGYLIQFLHLPALLGMLIVGVILGNVPHINVARHISTDWSAALRKVALAVILTRAGLGLDPKALKKMSCVVLRLAFLPCIVEAVTCMVSSHFILGLDWIWGLMLGFVLAAVSPAVVVPSLLSLSDRGYGLDKGIPTLVIAAASVDDVLAISAFSICLGISFSDTDNMALTVLKGPLEAIAGIVFGVLYGVVMWYIPQSDSKHVDLKRSALVLAGGLFALFGSTAAGIDGAGALGCLTLPFVAALRWRKDEEKLPTEIHMGYLWVVFQPLLFGLIGAAVNLCDVEDFFKVIGLGTAVLLIGLILRLITSFLAVFGTDFNLKEKFFIPLAWLPKATVQALLGSIALDKAKDLNSSDRDIEMGRIILTVAVLCILITAPVGAAAISISGPRLLHKSPVKPSTAAAATAIDRHSASREEEDKGAATAEDNGV